jgi:hypothetical protein
MKATLQFNLPKEQREYDIVVQAPKLQSFLWDFSEQLRTWYKYDNDFTDGRDAVIKIRDEFYRLMNNHDVNIDI